MRAMKLFLAFFVLMLIFTDFTSGGKPEKFEFFSNAAIFNEKRLNVRFAPGTPLEVRKAFFISLGARPLAFDVFGYDIGELKGLATPLETRLPEKMDIFAQPYFAARKFKILDYEIEEPRKLALKSGCAANMPKEKLKIKYELVVPWYDRTIKKSAALKYLAEKRVALASEGIVIADEGAAFEHPDIALALKKDKNGKPIFWSGDKNGKYKPGNHGTHVSCIAAAYCDGKGMEGAAGPLAYILPLAVNYNRNLYYFSSDIAIGLKYFKALENSGAIVFRVVNMSFGWNAESRVMKAAIKGLPNKIFVAAAGNETMDLDVKKLYPASWRFPNVIAVAATDYEDGLAKFSNYGKKEVDIGAPGVGIKSCLADGGYANWQGTSMATPLISGTAALVFAINPELSAADAKRIIFSGADVVAGLKLKIKNGRRLNILGAVSLAYKEKYNP